jgi:hypothetical protein
MIVPDHERTIAGGELHGKNYLHFLSTTKGTTSTQKGTNGFSGFAVVSAVAGKSEVVVVERLESNPRGWTRMNADVSDDEVLA